MQRRRRHLESQAGSESTSIEKSRLSFWPRSRHGLRSLLLLVLFALMYMGYKLLEASSGNIGGLGFLGSPWLIILLALSWLTAYAAFYTGVLAFTKNDRSITVLIGAATGLVFFFYVVIKMLAPP